jgi:hypothetical protein
MSSLTLASPVRGPSSDVMETHGSIVLLIALGAMEYFHTFLVIFFINGLMIPYEAIITSAECQAVRMRSPPSESTTSMSHSTWSPRYGSWVHGHSRLYEDPSMTTVARATAVGPPQVDNSGVTSAAEPPPPQHSSSKSSVLQCSEGVLVAGYIP